MGKNKSKKKKKPLFKNYKFFTFVGALFHIITWGFYEKTFFDEKLFWFSAGFCGLIFAIFFIKKTDLLNPKNYKKLDGVKLKLYMIFVCVIMTIGGIIIFGSVINGTILGLNYIGKNNESNLIEFQIERIAHNNSTGGRRGIRRNNPKVYLKKNTKLNSFNLPERWDSNRDYSEYKSIVFDLKIGLFGLEIIDDYRLKK